MIRYAGGNRVKGGLYWGLAEWHILPIPKEGGVLPGEPETRYLRVPLVMMLILGPMMGALLVVFLPVIGFGLLFGFGGVKLYAAARKLAVGTLAEQEAEAGRKPK